VPRQIVLASRPSGWPTAANFALTETDRPDLADGQIEQLREAAPDGIDIYFDNVGADHLDAALVMLKPHGRVAMSGAIAHYNATEPPVGPSNLGLVITKRLTLRGFIVSDHQHRMPDMIADVSAWLRDGKLAHAETVIDGLDHAPDAFINLLRGANTGKMIVRL
jgi:NADPH-dependent curcumin reductase CurA